MDKRCVWCGMVAQVLGIVGNAYTQGGAGFIEVIQPLGFQSPSDAVKAAIQIQTECKAHRDLKLRIGINLGEVVFENKDVCD